MNTRIPVLSRRALMSALSISGFAVLLSACGRVRSLLEWLLRVLVLLVRKVLVLPVLRLFLQARARRRRRVRHSIIRGKSKAPDGEFRAADVYGPAQNVPKPKTEEGYTNASLDGMTKSVKAWTEWRNYGLQTGDFKEAMKFVDKTVH